LTGTPVPLVSSVEPDRVLLYWLVSGAGTSTHLPDCAAPTNRCSSDHENVWLLPPHAAMYSYSRADP